MAGVNFVKLNIMAGTARALEQEELTDVDRGIFDRDFDLLVHKLSKADPELGENLSAEKEFYTGVCQVAKGYFNKKPFGGLKSATGQYGFSLLYPQFLKDAADGTLTNYFSWVRSVTTTAAAKTQAWIFGGASSYAYAESTSEEKEVIAFHTLLSYKPDPQLIMIDIEVNDYPYVPWSVEPFTKITKADKLYKLIPMPGRVVIHPGGKFRLRGWFDLLAKTVPTATHTIQIEIAAFGLGFAEYTQLAAANLDNV